MSQRKILFIWLIVLAGLAGRTPLQAQAGATLRARVTDSAGLPVEGADVTVRHSLSGRVSTCRTGEEGECEATLRETGEYSVVGRISGMDEAIAYVSTAGGKEQTRVVLRLQPEVVRSTVTVVSGSRLEELQEESPTKVEAVTRAQMQATGYERVADVLAEMPGVLTRRGNSAAVAGEQIQGIDSRQVLVLQDGLPVVGARGVKSGVINLNRQSVGRVERVEVAKGAGSPLFGSDALGGVINMITREPESPFEAGVTVSGGSLGAVDLRGDFGGRRRGFSYFVDLETHRQNSYGLIPTSPTTVGPDWRRNDLLVKLRQRVAPTFAVGFTANAYWNREEGRNFSETGLVRGLIEDTARSYAVVADWLPEARTAVQARAYRATFGEDSVVTSLQGNGAPALADLRQRLDRLDATLSHQLGTRQFLQAGGEWSQDVYRGVNRVLGDSDGQQITMRDVWIQDRIRLTSRLTAHAGLRATGHSLFGSAAVPKAGLVWRATESLILRASWGQGFRAPDLGQLYFRFANPSSFYQVIGNPNLRPEYGTSISTGAMLRARRYRVGVSLFRNNLRDLIDARMVGVPRSPAELDALLARYNLPAAFFPLLNRQTFVYFNVQRVYTQGMEVDGEVALRRQWRVGGAYTFLNAVDGTARLALPQRHRHHGFVKTEYVSRRFGLAANLRGTFFSHWLINAAQGTRGYPFRIWDGYISKDLPRGVQFFVAVDNLNNSRDRKLGNTPATFDRPDFGRTWRAGLRYQFNGLER